MEGGARGGRARLQHVPGRVQNGGQVVVVRGLGPLGDGEVGIGHRAILAATSARRASTPIRRLITWVSSTAAPKK